MKKKLLITGITLFALYITIGFLILPPILRSQIPAYVEENFDLNISMDRIKINPLFLSVAVDGFSLKDKQDLDLVKLQSLFTNFTVASIWEQAFTFDLISLTAPELFVSLRGDGTLNLQDTSELYFDVIEPLLTNLPIFVRQLELKNGDLKLSYFRDQEPVSFSVTPISTSVTNIHTDSSDESKLGLDFSIEDRGAVNVRGETSLHPLKVNLTISGSDLPVVTAHRFVELFTDADILDGRASIEGTAFASLTQEEGLDFGFKGDLGIKSFDATGVGHPLTSFENLSVSGIDASFLNYAINISKVNLSSPAALIYRDKDGKLNIEKIIEQLKDGSLAEVELPVDALATEPTQIELPVVNIANLLIEDGKAEFKDYSISPGFSLVASEAKVAINKLSTDGTPAEIKLSAALGSGGTFKANGTISPFSKDKKSSLKITQTPTTLPPFSSYSAKLLGHSLNQGSVSFTGEASLEGQNLLVKSDVLLDKLEISPAPGEAKSVLPLPLAIALLKDEKDQIQLELPIEANLDDKSLNIAKIISGSIGDVVQAIVTSPFSVLGGAIAGDADELGHINFEPESTRLSDSEEKKLSRVAALLLKKDKLSLRIKPVAAINLDEDSENPDLEELGEMASDRGEAIKEYLIETGNIPEEKIEILKPQINEEGSSVNLVQSELSIEILG